MDEKLTQLRYMVITAIFVNYKLDEDPIMRSTLDELLKPLVVKELKSFMLMLTQTPRNFRSVLELVADVVNELVRKRFDPKLSKQVADRMQKKLRALMGFASQAIKASEYDSEISYLKGLDLHKLKEKDQPLFSPMELFIIEELGFDKLLTIFDDDPYLFEKRISEALYTYQMQQFKEGNPLIEAQAEPRLDPMLQHKYD